MGTTSAQKKSTNVSINKNLLLKAREHKINLSKTLEQSLSEILKQIERDTWQTENAAAIEEYNRRIEEHGVFSDGLRSF